MATKNRRLFTEGLTSWRNSVKATEVIDWTEQLRLLNEVADLITPDLTVEQICAAIYANLNDLIDAFQFAVGLYNRNEGTITYKGGIEDGKPVFAFTFDATAPDRLASWCIRNEDVIFMNDFDKEYSKYLRTKPVPLAGSSPNAAIYVPLQLNKQLVGLITVRSMRKNAYKPHHLHLLKAVGNFIVRALEFSKLSQHDVSGKGNAAKVWKWRNTGDLSSASSKVLGMLTDREKEVLFLLATGLPNKALAEKLFVSPGTIKTHTLNIYEKMGVSNRTSAILKAVELGWIY